MKFQISSSRQLFTAFSLFFLISGGLCYAQLRSLYLKDLSLLQQSFREQSDRLDERMRRGVVAVDGLQSAITMELKNRSAQYGSIQERESLDHLNNILGNSLKSVPDAMRVYFISSRNSEESSFLPTSFSKLSDSPLLLQPFFKLGTPAVNPMQAPYWTKSFASGLGNDMIISRATPVYIADRFEGVVGLDISINSLMDTTRNKTHEEANVFVVGHDRNLLLHPRFNKNPNNKPINATTALPVELQPHLEQILQAKSGEMQSMAGYRVMHHNLRNVPWNFVLWIPESRLWLTTIKSSFWSSVVPWLGLITMLGIIMGEVRRRNIIQYDLQLKTTELSNILNQLKQTQASLIQNERMSSLSHLVAGIAHEINNPVSFIHGNLKYAQEYTKSLLTLVELYEDNSSQIIPEIQDYCEEIDLDFIKTDLSMMMKSMAKGTGRIYEIVLLLRNFARMDESELKVVNLHEGIESTVAIMRHRLDHNDRRPEITLKYICGTIPNVECYAGLINQVFMALLSNAVDAINDCSVEQLQENPPTLEIVTAMVGDDRVNISIRDNGTGIPDSAITQIFDPFFTTKIVGKGTGLGLAIAHQIITERHSGKLTCTTQTQAPNLGTTFTIELPINQIACPQSAQDSKQSTLRLKASVSAIK